MMRRAVPAALTGIVLGIALALTGCGQPSAPTRDAEQEDVAALAPVIDRNFPDPDVLDSGGTFYAYATNDNNRNVQVATSTDLDSWEVQATDVFPDLPSWVIPGKTWAPEVTEIAPGSFVLYFTATNFQPSLQCIGVATATDPLGPFVAVGEGMLICPEDEGGAIDASTFLDDDGTRYLLWKNDGNCCGLDTWLRATPLTPDGLSLAGETIDLVRQTEDWEGELVEAPTLVKRDGSYVLLYSANSYGADRYAVGVATAPALAGPWEKHDGPLLSTTSSGGTLIGPGGQDLVQTADGDSLVVHGWNASLTVRQMFVLPVEWDGAVPRPRF